VREAVLEYDDTEGMLFALWLSDTKASCPSDLCSISWLFTPYSTGAIVHLRIHGTLSFLSLEQTVS